MDGEEGDELLRVLNENRDLVATTSRQLGRTNRATMRIELASDKLVVYRPYRVSYHERRQLQNMINELQAADVIETINSPFATPVLLVREKNGEMRMCVDYRAINKATIKDKCPLPHVDDQLDRLRGQKYYTSIDLFSGYY